ncbi:unnamed protein product [Amoebophrya sp. A25]|nr:unnamed protein product [Amoebophrya sp. A25]|eukprot:GSA25T00001117001.1
MKRPREGEEEGARRSSNASDKRPRTSAEPAEAGGVPLKWCLEIRPDLRRGYLHAHLAASRRFCDASIRSRREKEVPDSAGGSTSSGSGGSGVEVMNILDLVVRHQPVETCSPEEPDSSKEGVASQAAKPDGNNTVEQDASTSTTLSFLYGRKSVASETASASDDDTADDTGLLSLDPRNSLRVLPSSDSSTIITLQFSFGERCVFFEGDDYDLVCLIATSTLLEGPLQSSIKCRTCMACLFPIDEQKAADKAEDEHDKPATRTTASSTSRSVIEQFQLPSVLWDTFSDCVACEECMPFRTSKFTALRGRLYWSKMYALLHADDFGPFSKFDLKTGRCKECGTYVGDHADASAGVQLFKHKISYNGSPTNGTSEQPVQDIINPSGSSGTDEHARWATRNIFSGHTDVGCVGVVLREALEVNSCRQFRLFLDESKNKRDDTNNQGKTSPENIFTPKEQDKSASKEQDKSTYSDADGARVSFPPEILKENATPSSSADIRSEAKAEDHPTRAKGTSTGEANDEESGAHLSPASTAAETEDALAGENIVPSLQQSIRVKVVAKRTKLLNIDGEYDGTMKLAACQGEENFRDHMCVWYRLENDEVVKNVTTTQGTRPQSEERSIAIRDRDVFKEVLRYLYSAQKRIPQQPESPWMFAYLPVLPAE